MVLKHVPLDVRSCETLPAEKLHEVTAEQRAAQVAASSLGIELVLAAIDNTPTEIEQAIACPGAEWRPRFATRATPRSW